LKKNIDTLTTQYQSKDIPDLIVTGYTILESLQAVVNACQDDPADLHIPQITFGNLHDCVVNVEGIVTDLRTLEADVSAKNWLNVFDDATNSVLAYQAI
jgi:hypothetical protein